jgi:diguanylate cyclase (GGDEF)-like protein
MVAVLCREGNTEAAMKLEQLWEKLAQPRRFDLLCAYPLNAFPDDEHCPAFARICAAHSHFNPPECLDTINDPDALYRTVALLQQRANALESELRRRQALERTLETQIARIATMASAVAELEHLAAQDDLTGLYNKRIFTDRLTHAVERAARNGTPLALIFIDLDGFKALNDRHGHDVGDCLLQQVATRLRQCARAADTVCRWGGDEFAVIAEDADAAHADAFVQRIALALRQAFVLGDTLIAVSASAGFSIFPDDADDAQGLVQKADTAMYGAKRGGKARESPERVRARYGLND